VNRPQARSGLRTIIGLLAALGLVGALAMPVFGVEDWATVTGYAEGTSDNNHPETWGENCDDAGVQGGDTWVLPELAEGMVYSLVVVKTGSEASVPGFVNTLFANPSAGQTVWADSDGSGDFSEGDKGISHIIVCTEEEEEEEATPTPTPTEEPTEEPTEAPTEEPTEAPTATVNQGELGGNPTPTPAGGSLPDTAIGQFGQVPATVLSLLLLGALGAMVYVRLARQR
jgi:hypothetical protein